MPTSNPDGKPPGGALSPNLGPGPGPDVTDSTPAHTIRIRHLLIRAFPYAVSYTHLTLPTTPYV